MSQPNEGMMLSYFVNGEAYCGNGIRVGMLWPLLTCSVHRKYSENAPRMLQECSENDCTSINIDVGMLCCKADLRRHQPGDQGQKTLKLIQTALLVQVHVT